MKILSTLLSVASLLLLSIAPASAQTASFGEVTAEQGGFGRAVAVHNSTVLVGESRNAHAPGIVYAYEKDEAGEWVERARIQAADGVVGDRFGEALAVHGDLLLVGAEAQYDDRGAAYLFQQTDAGNWSQIATLAAPDSVEDGRFGSSVALGEGMALVGTSRQDNETGAAYVFRQTDEGMWTRGAMLLGGDVEPGDRFGSTLALDGDYAMISAPRKDGGTVYAFQRDAPGAWIETTKLSANRLSASAVFGASISLHGDHALVGAPRDDGGIGTVLTYERNADDGTWDATGRLAAFDGREGGLFGASLAFDGQEAWVGAPGASSGAGRLYLFHRDADAGMWRSAENVMPIEMETGNRFGATIAAAGGIAVTGNIGADYNAGTATVLERDADSGTWTAQSTIMSSGDAGLSAITGSQVDCTAGQAADFGCQGVDLVSFLPTQQIGGARGVGLNDIWGWTDPQTGREYALVGRIDGTSFVDVTNPSNPVYIGDLPMTEGARANSWRDVKVYENHAYVVADNAGNHGMQVFDLTQLRDFDGTPMTFEETALYDRVTSAHNVVINTDTGFAYIVGAGGGGETCGGGLHMVNIQNPAQPAFAGCFADPSTGRTGTGYTHDAQCVVYEGPDAEHQGKEICIGANETAISIADVTDKENPVALSTGSYPDHAYVHQGWLTEDHRYFLQNDELDEINGSADSTRTLIWDVSDLDDPQLVREFFLSNPASDHNLYIKDGMMYQSNYVSGLRVLDVSDPTNPVEVGHFDTEPFGEDAPGFAGSWSNYPYFDSGIIIVSSMGEGLFILRPQKRDV
jgi:choice-of-anchor B domain-containing protein